MNYPPLCCFDIEVLEAQLSCGAALDASIWALCWTWVNPQHEHASLYLFIMSIRWKVILPILHKLLAWMLLKCIRPEFSTNIQWLVCVVCSKILLLSQQTIYLIETGLTHMHTMFYCTIILLFPTKKTESIQGLALCDKFTLLHERWTNKALYIILWTCWTTLSISTPNNQGTIRRATGLHL